MTREELSASYAIIRHNVRTYRSAGVVEVVKGKQLTESTLQKLEACQDIIRSVRGLALLDQSRRRNAAAKSFGLSSNNASNYFAKRAQSASK